MGKLSTKVEILLLCEDQQQAAFVKRFLVNMGWNGRKIRPRLPRPGQGSAVQYVINRFPKELAVHRRRNVSQGLIVVIDGDDHGVAARVAELEEACQKAGVRVGRPEEGVLVVVPTWRIETWLAYLEGETIDEKRRNYPRLPRPRDCGPHVHELAAMCRSRRLREPAPDSLVAACTEYRRWIAAV